MRCVVGVVNSKGSRPLEPTETHAQRLPGDVPAGQRSEQPVTISPQWLKVGMARHTYLHSGRGCMKMNKLVRHMVRRLWGRMLEARGASMQGDAEWCV